MRWVPAAAVRPHRCAFIPFIGSHHPKGFFDFGTEILAFDGHAYCSVVAAEQMASYMGWQPRGDQAAASATIRRLEARIAELEAEVEENARVVDAAHILIDAKAAA